MAAYRVNAATPYGDHYNHGDAQAADWGGLRGAPAMYLCYLCGRDFGLKSLPIHQPQCFAKLHTQWRKDGQGKDRWGRGGETQRQSPPVSPAERYQRYPGGGLSGAIADAGSARVFNKREQEVYENYSMCQCPHCGRTFKDAERLDVHMRGCKPNGIYAKNGFLTDQRRKVQKGRLGLVGGAAHPKNIGGRPTTGRHDHLDVSPFGGANIARANTPRLGRQIPRLPRHIAEMIVTPVDDGKKKKQNNRYMYEGGGMPRSRNPLDDGVVAGPLSAGGGFGVMSRGHRGHIRGASLDMDDLL